MAFSALNAKIRSNPYLSYVCSTHFWGPVSNFGVPLAAVMDMKKDPEIISGSMTGCLVVYSATFMRYALAVTPKNYLLFACHLVNFSAQSTQAVRWQRYWYGGGRDAKLLEQGKEKIESAASQVKEKATEVVDAVKK